MSASEIFESREPIYGEDAVAKFAEGLSTRVRNGEFSLKLARQ